MRIGIFGRGRLGSAIATQAGDNVGWLIGRLGTPETNVDVVIEASAASAVESHLEWAIENEIPFVIGTSGWSIPDLEKRVGEKIGVVVAPNFSLAVALMARLSMVMGRFANMDRLRDPYLLEHHHLAKSDAPSGTARMLANRLIEACPRKTGWKIGGPLESNLLSVGVLRAGATYSSHVVGVDHPSEVIEIRHEARSAAVFAAGALQAAAWIRDKKGVHDFSEIVAPMLNALFNFDKGNS